MNEWRITDFIGAQVWVSMPDSDERIGTVTEILEAHPIEKNVPFAIATSESIFLVVFKDDGTVIEVKGERFVRYHLVKEISN
jgi:hypothetical protein